MAFLSVSYSLRFPGNDRDNNFYHRSSALNLRKSVKNTNSNQKKRGIPLSCSFNVRTLRKSAANIRICLIVISFRYLSEGCYVLDDSHWTVDGKKIQIFDDYLATNDFDSVAHPLYKNMVTTFNSHPYQQMYKTIKISRDLIMWFNFWPDQ